MCIRFFQKANLDDTRTVHVCTPNIGSSNFAVFLVRLKWFSGSDIEILKSAFVVEFDPEHAGTFYFSINLFFAHLVSVVLRQTFISRRNPEKVDL